MKKEIEVVGGANGISCNVIATNEQFRALQERLAFSDATYCLLVRGPLWTPRIPELT